MNDRARLDVLLKDYGLIRDEALLKLRARQAITALFLPVIGSVIAAGYKAGPYARIFIFAVAIPGLCYETVYLWTAETYALRRASKYLYDLAEDINFEVSLIQAGRELPLVLTWERRLRDSLLLAERRSHYLRHYFINTLLFWLPAFFSAIFSGYLVWELLLCYKLRVGIVVTLVEFAVELMAIRIFWKKSLQIIDTYKTSSLPPPDEI